jgi:FAD dependent oxidoreductase TIGR03364
LHCALWSPLELNVDPRQAIWALPGLLERDYRVELQFGTLVRGLDLPTIETTNGTWHVDRAIVCSGNDFETLYPAEFAASGITRCKLQMLRTIPQPGAWQLGPCLCAGLTLLHYAAFSHCASLAALRARMDHDLPFERAEGIHVLLSQTAKGELTIGDHHAYGLTHDPFDREEVNQAILNYLQTFANLPSLEIAERWHGIYPRLPGNQTELVVRPSPNVLVVNGLGGAGMTLSFGLAEELVGALS